MLQKKFLLLSTLFILLISCGGEDTPTGAAEYSGESGYTYWYNFIESNAGIDKYSIRAYSADTLKFYSANWPAGTIGEIPGIADFAVAIIVSGTVVTNMFPAASEPENLTFSADGTLLDISGTGYTTQAFTKIESATSRYYISAQASQTAMIAEYSALYMPTLTANKWYKEYDGTLTTSEFDPNGTPCYLVEGWTLSTDFTYTKSADNISLNGWQSINEVLETGSFSFYSDGIIINDNKYKISLEENLYACNSYSTKFDKLTLKSTDGSGAWIKFASSEVSTSCL